MSHKPLKNQLVREEGMTLHLPDWFPYLAVKDAMEGFNEESKQSFPLSIHNDIRKKLEKWFPDVFK